ncbi:hypothetical protein K2Q02_01850 [Patescibacteria group bacterium]|nr:hypothetical protein [Patescibacteria group bacterium]
MVYDNSNHTQKSTLDHYCGQAFLLVNIKNSGIVLAKLNCMKKLKNIRVAIQGFFTNTGLFFMRNPKAKEVSQSKNQIVSPEYTDPTPGAHQDFEFE